MEVPTQAPVVVLRCGDCPSRRKLDSFTLAPNGDVITVTGGEPHSRWMGRLADTGPDTYDWPSEGARRGSSRRYMCHRRCGAKPAMRDERLERAVRDAIQDGRSEIVTGVDI
jgi:hypothetical protein